MLSARPATIVGDKPHHEFIDVYDASRHREKIIEILESWGMDVKLFASLIDYFVFTRADKSELSPGTVTAGRLVRLEERVPARGDLRGRRQQRGGA